MREKAHCGRQEGAYRREVKTALSINLLRPADGPERAAFSQSSLLLSTNCLRRLARPSVSAARALDNVLAGLGLFGTAIAVFNNAAETAGTAGRRFCCLRQRSSILIFDNSIRRFITILALGSIRRRFAREGHSRFRGRQKPFALRLFAGGLARPSYRLALFADALLRRLLVSATRLQLADDPFALHFLLQHAESLIDVIIPDENLHMNPYY
jgi:hypothetical protein